MKDSGVQLILPLALDGNLEIVYNPYYKYFKQMGVIWKKKFGKG